MQTNTLGKFGAVSRLTLGGGGIGQGWGAASDADSVGTIHRAIEAGIDLIDTAPGYANCERMIARAFKGRMPEHVRITTKYGLGTPPEDEVYQRLRTSLEISLATMMLDRVDIMLLHTEIRPDDFDYPTAEPARNSRSTSLTLFREAVVPAFEQLIRDGLIGGWGITGINLPDTTIDVLSAQSRPVAVQAITNLLDSAGAMNGSGVPGRPRDIIATANAYDVGVMGVRAVQAGALTAGFDRQLPGEARPDQSDFDRAAPYRALCREWGEDPAVVAHRYALGMTGVDTLVLGVKNVGELEQALAAERLGPLEPAQVAAIDGLGLRA